MKHFVAETKSKVVPKKKFGRDGRVTGPRGTPSAINTCLGWVLFGKINDSDVVDVANNTLEQEESKYFTGSGRSYAAVVAAGKKNDLRRPRRRNGRVAKGRDYSIRDMMIVEFTDGSLTK